MLAPREGDNTCASDGVDKVRYPEVNVPIDLGSIGKQISRIGYRADDGDVQYIIVDNAPLYLELEITSLEESVQFEIEGAISEDRRDRAAEAAEQRADMLREDALLNREIIGGL